MQEKTRTKLLIFIALVLVVLLAVWWYSGFSVQFMQFFAAEPEAVSLPEPPPGCYYEQTECTEDPCEPVLICPINPGSSILEGSSDSETSGTVSCSPLTQSIAIGDRANLLAAGGESAYSWSAPDGTPADGTGTSFAVTYDTSGLKKITVQSARIGSSGAIVDEAACSVNVIP